MLDWKGLYNWSMQYNDGTHPSEFKQMSEEDRLFLEKAFESVTLNEMKEIWKILDQIKIREGDDEKEINARCEKLEDLSYFIDGPEHARNIVRGKRFNEIINYFFETKHKEVKTTLGRIITQMMQNDNYVQKAAMELGIFQVLNNLNEEKDEKLISNYIYILTGIIYGNETSVRKSFVKEWNGVILLWNLLYNEKPKIKSKENLKNFKRLLGLINDLTKIVDEHGKQEMFDLRKETLEIIKNTGIHTKIIEMLKEFNYDGDDNNMDSIRLIFGIICNLAELHTKEEIIKTVEEMKDKLNLEGNAKKEEIRYLDDIIKLCSDNIELSKKEFKEKSSENTESQEIGGKDSMKIELKK